MKLVLCCLCMKYMNYNKTHHCCDFCTHVLIRESLRLKLFNKIFELNKKNLLSCLPIQIYKRIYKTNLHVVLFLHYYSVPSDFRSPVTRGGLFRGVRDPQASGTCMSWGGAHYRTFDRKHFHFHGTCTYLLASSTDATWTVYITSVCDSSGHCSKVLTHSFHFVCHHHI